MSKTAGLVSGVDMPGIFSELGKVGTPGV